MSKDYKLGYRPDIEGLRAIAILLVMAAHVKLPGFQGGFVGVDVFFVLSGYLITALLVLEMESTGTVNMWGFYARRLRRLAPGLLIVLIASCLLAWALLPPLQQAEQVSATASAAVWLSNFYYAFSQLDYFGPSAEESLFLHTWSLGVEEQFYLIWPWLLLLALGLGKKQETHTPHWKQVMWLVFAASLVLCLSLMILHPASAFYMMPTRAWQFSLGALTWLYLREKPGTPSPITVEICAGFGLAGIVLAALWYGPNIPYPGIRAVLPSLGAALLLAAGSRHAMTTTRQSRRGIISLLACRPMQALGHVSYSWYLWHWPILVLGAAVYVNASLTLRLALALLALILAWISYRCVELPLRHLNTPLRRPHMMVTGTMAILIACSLFSLRWLDLIDTKLFGSEYDAIMAANGGLSYGRDCDTWYSSADVTECTFGDEDAPHSAVLMGDSVGAQWFPALRQRFTQPGWKLTVITKSACPMIDKQIFYALIGRDYTECTTWRARAVEMLQTRHTDYIMLGSSHDYAVTPHDWTEGTQKILHALSPHAKEIVLIRGTPLLSFNARNCLASNNRLTRLLAGDNRCHSLAMDAESAATVYAALQTAAASFDNVRVLDMNETICPDDECNAERDGYIVFRDDRHLTAHFAEHLGEEFIRRLESPVHQD
jgi:peptidoglycan/LPS O-acetylase OafA/YrhL